MEFVPGTPNHTHIHLSDLTIVTKKAETKVPTLNIISNMENTF